MSDLDSRIDKLIISFDSLTSIVGKTATFMKLTEESIVRVDGSIRSTRRMMLIQTVLAGLVLLSLITMGWFVMRAWDDVARSKDELRGLTKMLVEQRDKTAATYDYLVKKFPEDVAEISIVQAQPKSADLVLRKVLPVEQTEQVLPGKPHDDGHDNRVKMIRRAIRAVQAVENKKNEEMSGGSE
jgi:hypothetical protein